MPWDSACGFYMWRTYTLAHALGKCTWMLHVAYLLLCNMLLRCSRIDAIRMSPLFLAKGEEPLAVEELREVVEGGRCALGFAVAHGPDRCAGCQCPTSPQQRFTCRVLLGCTKCVSNALPDPSKDVCWPWYGPV